MAATVESDGGRNALHLAESLETAVSVLAAHPEYVGEYDDSGILPIHLAAAQKDEEFLKLLVRHNASLNESQTLKGKTPLHFAAMANNTKVLEYLVSNGANMEVVDSVLQSTALVLSSMLNNVEASILLVKLGSNLEATDRLGSNVLHYAVRNNQRELTSLLLQQGMPIDSKDVHGCTCLHYAATNGNAEIVRLLISAKANLMALDREGHIPMHLAAAGGHTNVVKEFLSAKVPYGYSSPNNNSTALYYASLSGNDEIIRILIKLGSELYHQCNGSQTALHAAASRGHLSSVKILLELGSNVTVADDCGQIPLHKAAKYGHKNCVEFLLRKAPHTVRYRDHHGHTPMGVASMDCRSDCMELLLQAEATSPSWVDRAGRSQLHWAACAGHSTLLRELLKTTHVETPDKAGKTALHWAISSNQEESVRVLLEHGASITTTSKDDQCNAIHYASMLGCKSILQMMFGARIVQEVNTTNKNGSPLLFAAYNGCSRSLEFLIEKGADVMYKTKGNTTILHAAVRGGCDMETISLLLTKGMSEMAENDAGETSIHYAANLQTNDILSLFLGNNPDKKVNLLTKKKNTPLHYAASSGSLSCITTLTNAGASKTALNINNETAAQLAEKKNHSHCNDTLI